MQCRDSSCRHDMMVIYRRCLRFAKLSVYFLASALCHYFQRADIEIDKMKGLARHAASTEAFLFPADAGRTAISLRVS